MDCCCLPLALRKRRRRHFIWTQLESSARERQRLCGELASKGFAVLRLPPDWASLVLEVQGLAMEFFDRPLEERQALARLRLFRDRVMGYRELNGGASRFLEVHAMPEGHAVPAPRQPRDLAPAAARLHAVLQRAALTVLAWMAEAKGLPPAALQQALDVEGLENLEPGDCGASVLRLCCYGCLPQEDGALGFDEHTDASFLTLAARGSQPGLEIREDDSWLSVEEGLEQGRDLVLFVGDFVEVLTKGSYIAARHRVARKGSERRFSMPFLVRGQPAALLDTSAFDTDGPLLRLEGMRYAEMRRFLDLKARQRFQGEKLLRSQQ